MIMKFGTQELRNGRALLPQRLPGGAAAPPYRVCHRLLPGALLALASAFWLLPSAFADLSAVVQPGYVFGPLERPSTSTLNRLGNPTITITGTIGGTNAGIAAGAINGTHFSDTVVDGTNITFNGASPRALKIVDAGVNVTQISEDIAGDGLGGGSGTNLFLQLDTNASPGLALTDDRLVLTNIPPFRLNVTSNYVVVGTTNDTGLAMPLSAFAGLLFTNGGFTTAEFALASGQITDSAHGLSNTPSLLTWVLVCQTNEFGYSIGDEIPTVQVTRSDGGASAVFAGGCNSTNLFMAVRDHTLMRTLNKTTGAVADLTPARWKLKGYVRP